MEIMKAVEKVCNNESIPFEHVDEVTLRIRSTGSNGEFVSHVNARQGAVASLAVVTLYPLVVPADRRAAVGDLILRINVMMRTGAISMDPGAGVVLVKTAVLYGGVVPDAEIIKHLILANLVSTDCYLPALASVAFGSTAPDSALKRVIDVLREDPSRAGVCTPVRRRGSSSHRLGDLLGPSNN